MHFICRNGLSSLLFIWSAREAFRHSTLACFQWGNVGLVVASFLNNATEFQYPLLQNIDLLTIYWLCLSYLNERYINLAFSLMFTLEYAKYRSITYVKNVAFVTGGVKAVVHTYLYVDAWHGHQILCALGVGTVVYLTRGYTYDAEKRLYFLAMTTLWHLCILHLLSVGSLTAV